MANNFQVMMNFMKQVANAQKNPVVLADLLLQRGAINQDTYDKIKGKSPSQMGEYLVNNGVLDRGTVQQMYQGMSPAK